MDVTQRMHDAWKDVRFPAPVENTQSGYTAQDHQRNRQHYAAMIENIDRHVGRFLEVVKERGELDRTLIVYASDHGEMLGDQNRWGKVTWYTPSSGIPLIVAGSGMVQGVTSTALVSLYDLTATFLDYAGAAPLPKMTSRSLRGLLEGRTEEDRNIVLSGLDDWRMAFDGRYKLVLRSDAQTLLFDVDADPFELNNIAQTHPAVAARLTQMMHDEEGV
jgi:arylsulfatase A-like enzyme